MLGKVGLGGREYRQIFDEAQKLIPAYASSWTNLNQSDPGITILQSLALLSSKLDEAAEKTSEQDEIRLLKLLNYPVAFAEPAKLTLFLLLHEHETLMEGTPFLLKGAHFELEQKTAVHAGAVIGVTYAQGEEARDVSALVHAKTRLSLFEGDEKNPAVIELALSHAAKKGEALRIYFGVGSKFPRNKTDGAIPFAKVKWEAFGKNGFARCKFKDDTSCFTQSGAVEITLSNDMAVLNGAYRIRATISQPEYDVNPQIKRIWGGHVELAQKRTLSRCVCFSSGAEEDIVVPLPFWDVNDSNLLVLGRDENGNFRRYYPDGQNKARSYYVIEDGGGHSIRICCEKMPKAGADSVRILARRPEALPLLELGSVTGYDGQRLNPKWQGEYPVCGAKLMLRQKYGEKTVYEDVDEPDCNVFCELSPDGAVTVRRAATDGDNLLFFSHLSLTLGEGGNLSKKSLGEYSPGGSGGKNPGSLAQSVDALNKELNFPCIAITLADYERHTLETPGLAIESASARTGMDGTIQVAVKPYSDKRLQKLGARQKNAIAGYLEERRVLGTKIEIVSPSWIPVEIYIDVSVLPQAVSPKEQISSAIADGVKWGAFGTELSYGKLHALLDALDCVESVSRLSICAGGVENDNIESGFATLFYLNKLNINCETRV